MDTNKKIYDFVMECFDSDPATRREVANGSGVPFSTVCKIAQRETKNPSVHHIQALYDYFVGKMKEAA